MNDLIKQANRLRDYHQTCIMSSYDLLRYHGPLDTPERRDYRIYKKKYLLLGKPLSLFLSYVKADMQRYLQIINNKCLVLYHEILVIDQKGLENDEKQIIQMMIEMIEEEIVRRFLKAFDCFEKDVNLHIRLLTYCFYHKYGLHRQAYTLLDETCLYYYHKSYDAQELASLYHSLDLEDHGYISYFNMRLKGICIHKMIEKCLEVMEFSYLNMSDKKRREKYEEQLSKIYHCNL